MGEASADDGAADEGTADEGATEEGTVEAGDVDSGVSASGESPSDEPHPASSARKRAGTAALPFLMPRRSSPLEPMATPAAAGLVSIVA
jgi:hypothetical protein